MGMTDPIADMLTRIRNASRARHQRVAVPWSRLKENIVKILIEEGYLKDQKKVKAAVGGGEEMVIQLKFDRENRPIITGMKRVSYAGAPGLCRRQGVGAGSQRLGNSCALDAERNLGRSGSAESQGRRRTYLLGMVG